MKRTLSLLLVFTLLALTACQPTPATPSEEESSLTPPTPWEQMQAISEDLSAASAALSAADNALTEQHSGAEQRLDELAREMERSAADVTAPIEEAAPADFF
jgi:hypothetical protein